MLLKNLPFPQLIWTIFCRLCLDGAAALHLGFTQGISHLWAVARAHFAFYGQAPETWRRRAKIQQSKFYQTKWLIFKHFLKLK